MVGLAGSPLLRLQQMHHRDFLHWRARVIFFVSLINTTVISLQINGQSETDLCARGVSCEDHRVCLWPSPFFSMSKKGQGKEDITLEQPCPRVDDFYFRSGAKDVTM